LLSEYNNIGVFFCILGEVALLKAGKGDTVGIFIVSWLYETWSTFFMYCTHTQTNTHFSCI